MAGKPGMKGGGGARPGAGRKPKPKTEPAPPALIEPGTDMLQFLQDVALGRIPDATSIQVRAAIAAVQYTHTKTHDGGKKDAIAEKAKKVDAGKFKAAPEPLKLVRA